MMRTNITVQSVTKLSSVSMIAIGITESSTKAEKRFVRAAGKESDEKLLT